MQSPLQASEHGHKHHDMKKIPAAAMEHKAVHAVGIVDQIVADQNKLKITHEPIKGWNMGAMRMTFHAGPKVDISQLKEGQKIKFMATNPKVGTYVVTKIMP